mgnify:CR=1 FL=1
MAGGTAAAAGGAGAAPELPSADTPTPDDPPTTDEVALGVVARAAVQAGQLTQTDAMASAYALEPETADDGSHALVTAGA